MLHTTKKLHKQSVLDPNKQQYYIHTNNNIDTNKHIHRNKDTETTTTTDDEETAVLLVPTILPTSTTTTTMDGRSTKWISRVASVAGMMMLGGITTTAEGLVVATHGGVPCVPASLDATFSGVSATGNSHYFPFQTCYQNGDKREYCWTNAYYRIAGPNLGGKEYMPCRPVGDDWGRLDPRFVNPVTHPFSCGKPCQSLKRA